MPVLKGIQGDDISLYFKVPYRQKLVHPGPEGILRSFVEGFCFNPGKLHTLFPLRQHGGLEKTKTNKKHGFGLHVGLNPLQPRSPHLWNEDNTFNHRVLVRIKKEMSNVH